MKYQGKVYKAPSGQWAWVIYEADSYLDVVRGAGYETEEEATEALNDQLAEYEGLS